MNEQYEVVPNIISGKDLDYLSDMFNWNYGAYKSSFNAISNVNDEEIKDVLQRSSNMFYDFMIQCFSILENGGQNE